MNRYLTFVLLVLVTIPAFAQQRQIRAGDGLKERRRDTLVISLDAARARVMTDSVCIRDTIVEKHITILDSLLNTVRIALPPDTIGYDWCNPCTSVRMAFRGGRIDSVYGASPIMIADSTMGYDSTQIQTIRWNKLVSVNVTKNFYPTFAVPLAYKKFRHFMNRQGFTTTTDWFEQTVVDWLEADTANFSFIDQFRDSTWQCGTKDTTVSYLDPIYDHSTQPPTIIGYDTAYVTYPVPVWCTIPVLDKVGQCQTGSGNKPGNDSTCYYFPLATARLTMSPDSSSLYYTPLPDSALLYFPGWRATNTYTTDVNGDYVYNLPHGYWWCWVPMCTPELKYNSGTNAIDSIGVPQMWVLGAIDGFTGKAPGGYTCSLDPLFAADTTTFQLSPVNYVYICPGDTTAHYITELAPDQSKDRAWKYTMVPVPGTIRRDYAAEARNRKWHYYFRADSVHAVAVDTCACTPRIIVGNRLIDLCTEPLFITAGDVAEPMLLGQTLILPGSGGTGRVRINGRDGNSFNGVVFFDDLIRYGNQIYDDLNGKIQGKQDLLPCSPCDTLDSWRPRLDSLEQKTPCNPCADLNKTVFGEIVLDGSGKYTVDFADSTAYFLVSYANNEATSDPDATVVHLSWTYQTGHDIQIQGQPGKRVQYFRRKP